VRSLGSLFLLWVLTFGSALASGPALAADQITGCDRLAANPPDPDRVSEGVPRGDVDIPAAIAACRIAIEAAPAEARFSYQLARVLFYDGQTATALESFNRAIEQDYRQAKFLVGLIMTRGYDGVPDDVCRVEALWRASARQNHANAQVSYVQLALQGRFNGCDARASNEEMADFLTRAEAQLGYIGGLLVATPRDDLNN
jgi:tetratricopeptide (TPR) repeat protein